MKFVVAFLIAAGIVLISRTALCEENEPLSPIGLGVSAGAGVTGFVDGDMREAADPGGTWDVRVAAGTRLPVAFEAAYVGSAQAIDVNQQDDVFTLSLAIGVDVRLDRIVLDARAVMRPTFDNQLVPDSGEPGNPTRLDSLSLLVRAGVEL